MSAQERRKGWTVSQWLGFTALVLLGAGFVVIGIYAFSTSGSHVRYLGVGLLTAFASVLVGFLVGFLFGIPKVVSSGELRLRNELLLRDEHSGDTGTKAGSSAAAGEAAPDERSLDSGRSLEQASLTKVARGTSDQPGASDFVPSTNLSEVSDWLTKLLLGAGLVQLTSLGAPIGALISTVASGLEEVPTGEEPSGSAQVIAGAILVGYFVLGFLCGYVLTTLWYGRRLREV